MSSRTTRSRSAALVAAVEEALHSYEEEPFFTDARTCAVRVGAALRAAGYGDALDAAVRSTRRLQALHDFISFF